MTERRILIVVYPGFELLDVAGPTSVFHSVEKVTDRAEYRVEVVSVQGGAVASGSGVSIQTRSISRVRLTPRDTVLVSGGDWGALEAAQADSLLMNWIARAAERAGRFGSVCAGAIVLAATGKLDGIRATTHWDAMNHVKKASPDVDWAGDDLWVCDGRAWTSAGVTTGIDMALAIVERDLGMTVMGAVAKLLVVYARRPGNQSQFSATLGAQLDAGDELRDLVAYIDTHLNQDLVVDDLARRSNMTTRTFHRKFVDRLGTTPAKYVEEARMDRARSLIEEGASAKAARIAVGYRSDAAFRRAFSNRFGVNPSLHQKLHDRT